MQVVHEVAVEEQLVDGLLEHPLRLGEVPRHREDRGREQLALRAALRHHVRQDHPAHTRRTAACCCCCCAQLAHRTADSTGTSHVLDATSHVQLASVYVSYDLRVHSRRRGPRATPTTASFNGYLMESRGFGIAKQLG